MAKKSTRRRTTAKKKTTAKEKTTTKKPGRPKGSKNQDNPVVDKVLPKCEKCGSTDRGPYFRTSTQFTVSHKITRQWCKCSQCGQVRIERTLGPVR